MSNPAQAILEEIYEYALNPNESYSAQLEPLAATGELSNRASLNKILFKLCEVVDQQAKKIKLLEDDRVAIAQKMTELEEKNVDKSAALPQPQNDMAHNKTEGLDIVNTDPTQPLDEPSTQGTEPNSDNNL